MLPSDTESHQSAASFMQDTAASSPPNNKFKNLFQHRSLSQRHKNQSQVNSENAGETAVGIDDNDTDDELGGLNLSNLNNLAANNADINDIAAADVDARNDGADGPDNIVNRENNDVIQEEVDDEEQLDDNIENEADNNQNRGNDADISIRYF
ncbi:hypothetical protein TSAR_005107 [Trichomalopsis sarcophagae]|uniref:Uncharacterized protein n=1 Tax=Trichomalopsis sarcophagae TaxID=543379 RepID=A0A232F3I8_9HYME|nr:hypothetical protein TSAR_005107 [Trichomalopsis sarcophagae]